MASSGIESGNRYLRQNLNSRCVTDGADVSSFCIQQRECSRSSQETPFPCLQSCAVVVTVQYNVINDNWMRLREQMLWRRFLTAGVNVSASSYMGASPSRYEDTWRQSTDRFGMHCTYFHTEKTFCWVFDRPFPVPKFWDSIKLRAQTPFNIPP